MRAQLMSGDARVQVRFHNMESVFSYTMTLSGRCGSMSMIFHIMEQWGDAGASGSGRLGVLMEVLRVGVDEGQDLVVIFAYAWMSVGFLAMLGAHEVVIGMLDAVFA